MFTMIVVPIVHKQLAISLTAAETPLHIGHARFGAHKKLWLFVPEQWLYHQEQRETNIASSSAQQYVNSYDYGQIMNHWIIGSPGW